MNDLKYSRRRCCDEIKVLKMLTEIPNSKDYFVQFKGSYEKRVEGGTSIYIVMEYCKYGTLRCLDLTCIIVLQLIAFAEITDQFN